MASVQRSGGQFRLKGLANRIEYETVLQVQQTEGGDPMSSGIKMPVRPLFVTQSLEQPPRGA
jgi:hypothetical protein